MPDDHINSHYLAVPVDFFRRPNKYPS